MRIGRLPTRWPEQVKRFGDLPMISNGDGTVPMWHLLWTLALSVISAFCMIIGAVFRWNWIKLYEQVQHKADRTDVSAKHADNVIRLEEIKKMLLHSEKVSSATRCAASSTRSI